MFVRNVSVVFVAAIAAMIFVLGASAVRPEKAEAAATVATCIGGTITLTDTEKQVAGPA